MGGESEQSILGRLFLLLILEIRSNSRYTNIDWKNRIKSQRISFTYFNVNTGFQNTDFPNTMFTELLSANIINRQWI